ncbi:MAG: OmpA family protein [Nitrospira sp.]|nr:OmpA family protein [Nitrospira sp.]
MSQGSSQVSSGSIAPKVMGPQKETKEGIVLAGVVLFMGGLLAAVWLYSQASNQVKASATNKIQHAEVTDLLKKTAAVNQAEASTTHLPQVGTPVASIPDIIHADIYFEVGRKGLTDEGKVQLSAQAAMLNQHEDYGVLIQGYTDQQGSASYNKQLGMKRAEAVKAELVGAGIAEHRMKTVSLGEEGALCVDGSDICRYMNRRVHLEVRKIGQEHMVLPPAPVTTSEPSGSSIDPSSIMEDGDSTTESIPPAPSDPTTTLESVTGS